jgi:hypothetical protein
MGTRNQARNSSNIVAAALPDTMRKRREGYLPEILENTVDGDVEKLFDGKTRVGFNEVDSFAFNPRTGELLPCSRFACTHEEIIEEFGEEDSSKYVLGFINFPGTSRDIPPGWMTEMVKERTISLRYEGSFYDKDDYRRVKDTLDLLVKYGAPLDYKVIILFGESRPSRGGFLDDRPNGTTIRYENLENRKLLV